MIIQGWKSSCHDGTQFEYCFAEELVNTREMYLQGLCYVATGMHLPVERNDTWISICSMYSAVLKYYLIMTFKIITKYANHNLHI